MLSWIWPAAFLTFLLKFLRHCLLVGPKNNLSFSLEVLCVCVCVWENSFMHVMRRGNPFWDRCPFLLGCLWLVATIQLPFLARIGAGLERGLKFHLQFKVFYSFPHFNSHSSHATKSGRALYIFLQLYLNPVGLDSSKLLACKIPQH